MHAAVRLLLILGVSTSGLSANAAAAVQSAQQIVVSAEGAGVITVVDAATLRVVKSVPVGARPHNLAALNQDLILVATQGARAVSLVDLADVKAVRIDIGFTPHDIAAAPDGRRVFVLGEAGGLAAVDVRSGKVDRRINLAGRPHDLAVLGQTIWVTHLSTRFLSILNGGTLATVARVAMSDPGHDLAPNPARREVWITPWTGNRVAIVDSRSYRLLTTITVGRSPQHPAFTPDGREAWITETQGGVVYVIDTSTRRVRASIAVGGPPHHIAVDTRRAYVAVGPSRLVVIDVGRKAILGRVPVGASPHDIILR